MSMPSTPSSIPLDILYLLFEYSVVRQRAALLFEYSNKLGTLSSKKIA